MSRLVLVTGASGGVGRALLTSLRDVGWRTRALVHRRPADAADESVRGDLLDGPSLSAATDGVDAVVHLAAVTHARRPSTYEGVNVGGTRNLLEAAGVVSRFVHVSTRAIDARGGAYSQSKNEAERLVGQWGLPFVIVRLPEVYGVGGREGIDKIVARARRGRPILVVGDGSDEICPIALPDAVAPLVAALEREAGLGKTYTLAGECMTVRTFAERSAAAFGSKARIIGVPAPAVAAASVLARVAPLPVYPDQLTRLRAPKPKPDDAARRDLGFRARRLEDGLRNTWA